MIKCCTIAAHWLMWVLARQGGPWPFEFSLICDAGPEAGGRSRSAVVAHNDISFARLKGEAIGKMFSADFPLSDGDYISLRRVCPRGRFCMCFRFRGFSCLIGVFALLWFWEKSFSKISCIKVFV